MHPDFQVSPGWLHDYYKIKRAINSSGLQKFKLLCRGLQLKAENGHCSNSFMFYFQTHFHMYWNSSMQLCTFLWLFWLQLKNHKHIPYFSQMKPVKVEVKLIPAISTSKIIPKYQFQDLASRKTNKTDLHNVMKAQKKDYKNLWSPEPFKQCCLL